MALPPAWIAVYDQAQYLAIRMTKEQAQALVRELEVKGWRIAPAYAVDDSKLPEGVRE